MKAIEVMTETASLGELVELARKEAGVVLTKYGEPVALLIPIPKKQKQRIAPLHQGAWDVSEDFDEPLAAF